MSPSERFLAALALGAAFAVAVAAPRRVGERAVIAAVDAEAFSGLSGRRPAAAQDLWERLKAMGVSAVILREENLADMAAQGEILHFTAAEVEKWRAAGLVSPATGLRGDTIWVKEPVALTRAAEALAARGIDITTGTTSGIKTLLLPSGVDLARVPAGFDPAEVAVLSGAGLLPVAASTGAFVTVAGRTLSVRGLAVDAHAGEILRAALGRPLRLVVFHPRPELGLDANLDFLRASLRVLRSAGEFSTLPASRGVSSEDRLTRGARLVLLWLIGVVGPLLAVRAALRASLLVHERALTLAPMASPVPEVLAGLVATWIVAAFAGLVVAGMSPEGWRDGSARAWTIWTWCASLAVGVIALSWSELRSRRRWSASVRRRDLAAVIAFVLAAGLLLAPRASLPVSGLWEWMDRFSAAAGPLWWWPWRWREALVGVPALVVAFLLIGERGADPRGWLLLGLLAPAGLIAAVGGSGAPIDSALAQGAATYALGALVGAAVYSLRTFANKT